MFANEVGFSCLIFYLSEQDYCVRVWTGGGGSRLIDWPDLMVSYRAQQCLLSCPWIDDTRIDYKIWYVFPRV